LNKLLLAASAFALATSGLTVSAQGTFEPFRAASPTDSPTIHRLVADIKLHGRDAVDAFWDDVARSGAPLIEPIAADGESSYVTFVWRGDSSTRNVAVIDGVAVGVGDADPARSLMDRLADSDVWYRTYVVRNDGRFHYWLSPNDSLESLELDKRSSHPSPDPLNPRRMSLGLSYVELKDAPQSVAAITRSNIPAGEVRQLDFHSEVLGNDRKVSVYTPPGFTREPARPYALLIVFDGEAYQSLVPVPTILDNLIHDGAIPPTIAVFVTHPNGNAELHASSEFVDFLANELVPWAQRMFTATGDPSRVVVAGSSAGGLAATYAAFARPDVFGKVLAQSPSLWWSPPGSGDEGWVPQKYAASKTLPITFYMEVGDMEASIQRRPILRMRDILSAKGYELKFRGFNGGHSYLSWRHSFAPALVYLLGGDGVR
jgi:enterochelin esterase family protein